MNCLALLPHKLCPRVLRHLPATARTPVDSVLQAGTEPMSADGLCLSAPRVTGQSGCARPFLGEAWDPCVHWLGFLLQQCLLSTHRLPAARYCVCTSDSHHRAVPSASLLGTVSYVQGRSRQLGRGCSWLLLGAGCCLLHALQSTERTPRVS